MTREDLQLLIAKLTEATGPDRALDADLWWMLSHADALRCFNNGALGLPRDLPATLPIPAGLGRAGVQAMAPRYTASIDAIHTLIRKRLPGWAFSAGDDYHEDQCWARLFPRPREQHRGTGNQYAATVPLAMCVAFLLAVSMQPAEGAAP